MASIEQLMKELDKDDTYASRVVDDAEEEFLKLSTIEEEREKDRLEIAAQLKALKTKLRNAKNIRNHKKTDVNKSLSDKRKRIKQEIALLELKLEDLKMEKAGSEVTTDKLLSPSNEKKY